MKFNQYQKKIRKFVRYPKENALLYLTTGLAVEVGEFLGLIAKMARKDPGKNMDNAEFANAIAKELGDILWFVAQLADLFDIDLSVIAERNILKLKGRTKRGTLKGDGDER